MLIATEPNGENPNSVILDMGDWFRTANKGNKYYKNKMFFNRTAMIANGIHGEGLERSLRHTRFFDLKATSGGAKSLRKEVETYIKDNRKGILKYFRSNDLEFGLFPHCIIMLGNDAYSLFKQLLRNEIFTFNQNMQWVCLPHPSAQTVYNPHFQTACEELNNKLVDLTQVPWKWFCRGKLNNGWKKA